MILAVVLSAIVLFGWSFVSRALLPDRQPAGRPRSRTASQVADCRSRQASPAANAPARDARPRDRAARERRASRSTRRASPARSTSRGARIDDLVLTSQRETIDAEFAAGPPVLARRRARRLFRRLRLDRPGRSPLPGPTRSGRRAAAALTPATPVTLSWNNGQGQIFEIASRSTTTICSPSSSASSTAAPAPVAVAALRLVSRVGRLARSRHLDRPCRPGRRVQRRGRLQQQLRATSPTDGQRRLRTATAAGSASPTNIGWPRSSPTRRATSHAALPPRRADRRLSGRLRRAADARRRRARRRAPRRHVFAGAKEGRSCSDLFRRARHADSSGRSTGAGSAGS